MRFWMMLVLVFAAGCAKESVPKNGHAKMSMSKFEREVLESPAPVLVEFGIKDCQPCRLLDPILDRLEKDMRVVRVDAEENPELAARFDVSSFPAIFFIVPGESPVRYQGPRSEAFLRAAFAKLSTK